mgnify:CR=1 FL=1
MRKKHLSFIMAFCVMLNLSTVAMADNPEYTSMIDDATTRQKILASDYAENIIPNYISVDEYLEKYGTINVIKGFNKAETEHKVNVLKTANEDEKASLMNDVDTFSAEPNDLYLSITEGEFLGLDIVGISDLAPDDTRLSIQVRDNGVSNIQNKLVAAENTDEKTMSTRAANQIRNYTNYRVYFSDNEPNNSTDLLGGAYEPKAGTYMYKYSYAYANNYLCSTEVQFSNTQLKCGTESNNMYTYIAAKSNQQTLDFGLMANPAASNRNKGLYACYNPSGGVFNVEAYPKVQATSYGNNMMTLENKTVTIRLSIGNGTAEMYMESNGSCIYYKTINMSSLISGGSTPLTFIQAMSCVKSDGSNTSLTSGSYFKNVRFNNTSLYSFDSSSARSFSTYGPNTYYTFIAKPSKMSFSYGSNYESMSIIYN